MSLYKNWKWPHSPRTHFRSWWRHQMEAFSPFLTICVGNSPITGEFPSQGPVTRSFDGFFNLRLKKGLCKQSWGWWFETPLHSLWRHCNETLFLPITYVYIQSYLTNPHWNDDDLARKWSVTVNDWFKSLTYFFITKILYYMCKVLKVLKVLPKSRQENGWIEFVWGVFYSVAYKMARDQYSKCREILWELIDHC